MAILTYRQCDQCSEKILDRVRWFRMGVQLLVINSHTRSGERDMSDFCSERCLLDALTTLIHETEVTVSLTIDTDTGRVLS